MSKVLSPTRMFTENYVDDIACHSRFWEEHLSHLRQFLEVIRHSGFTLSLKKCNWAQPSVKFLGSIIGSGRRRANPDKEETVKNLRIPRQRNR
jgi:hypothetical protein